MTLLTDLKERAQSYHRVTNDRQGGQWAMAYKIEISAIIFKAGTPGAQAYGRTGEAKHSWEALGTAGHEGLAKGGGCGGGN